MTRQNVNLAGVTATSGAAGDNKGVCRADEEHATVKGFGVVCGVESDLTGPDVKDGVTHTGLGVWNGT